MAETRLTDVIVPEVYDEYLFNEMLEKSSVIKSGIAVNATNFGEFLKGGGKLFDMPAWNQLTDESPDIASDDPAEQGTASKITAYSTQAIRHSWAKAWSSMALARELAGSDPMQQVADSAVKFWDLQLQRYLIASAEGVLNDNIANDSSDMVNSIATTVNGDVPDATNKWSSDAYIDTLLTMGDRMDEIGAIYVHSIVYNTMQKENRIDTTPESKQISRFGTYDGAAVYVNDLLPVNTDAVTGLEEYTSMVVGSGAFGIGVKAAERGATVDYDEKAGNNFGQETLYNRMVTMIHPDGFDFTDASVAKESPTDAEYKLAANWDRKVERKRAKMAFIVSNG